MAKPAVIREREHLVGGGAQGVEHVLPHDLQQRGVNQVHAVGEHHDIVASGLKERAR